MDFQIVNITKNISGSISLPASKSISNRALIIRAVGGLFFGIYNLSESNDTKVLQEMLFSQTNTLNAEDAGTAMRFMTALAASTFGEWIITGTDRMKLRPIGDLVDCLNCLGASIEYLENAGFPPLKIKGIKLKGEKIVIQGNISSQFISALLMIAPYVMNGITIHITEPFFSKPYVKMTLQLMEYFGIKYLWVGNEIIIKEQEYKPKELTVESDWSAAAFWYEIVALSENADIILTGLKKQSLQGDCIIAEIFEQLGVKTTSVKNGVRLTKTHRIVKNIQLNCSDFPDMIPALTVSLTMLGVPFDLTGLASLRIKECDRIVALQTELEKVGIYIQTTDNSMKWDGVCSEKIYTLLFDTYNDHRIAMALAPVSLKYNNIKIKNTDVVRKSYPEFWNDLIRMGFSVDQAF